MRIAHPKSECRMRLYPECSLAQEPKCKTPLGEHFASGATRTAARYGMHEARNGPVANAVTR
jgi:hypothetical protein